MSESPVSGGESKKPWESKSVIAALIVAIAAFFPPVQKFIVENPTAYTEILAGIFFFLRLVTKGKVSIS